MSYCKFENTLSELGECVEAMQNAQNMTQLDLSEYELNAFHSMWREAKAFLAEHERLINAPESDSPTEEYSEENDQYLQHMGYEAAMKELHHAD
jgi:exonuclease VII small subunit